MGKRCVLSITLIMLSCIVIGFSLSTNAISADSYFSNEKWGLKFIVPEGVNAYTSEIPGPMASRINADTPLWLVSSSLASERINLKVSQFQNAREKELDETKQELDSGTLYRSIPQYQKVSVKYITIGKQSDKKAVEHIHDLKQKEPRKLRQIMFIHKGRVFNFTCATSPERFDNANRQFFDLIFGSMEFK
jgi:hypothetical protein